MPKVSYPVLAAIELALEDYKKAVYNAPTIASGTKDAYTRYAQNFIDWIKGNFDPDQLAKPSLQRP